MHRSKLAGFIIDCQTDDLRAAATFWGGALGMPVRRLPASEGEVRCAGGPKRATAHRSAGGDTRKPGPSRHRNRRHGCRGCATRSPGSNQGQTNPHVVGHASADWSALLSRMDQVQAFRISSDGYGVALAHDSRIEPCALFDGHDARQADWQYALNQDLTVSCDIECSGHAR